MLRITTSDTNGNLTYGYQGACLGGPEQAVATHNKGELVIAQVSRKTMAGSLSPLDVRIPGNLMDLVVLDPHQRQTT